MFVIDAGVAILRKYEIGGTLRCKVIFPDRHMGEFPGACTDPMAMVKSKL